MGWDASAATRRMHPTIFYLIPFYDYICMFHVFHICFYKIIFYYDIIDITYYRYGGNNKILFKLS